MWRAFQTAPENGHSFLFLFFLSSPYKNFPFRNNLRDSCHLQCSSNANIHSLLFACLVIKFLLTYKTLFPSSQWWNCLLYSGTGIFYFLSHPLKQKNYPSSFVTVAATLAWSHWLDDSRTTDMYYVGDNIFWTRVGPGVRFSGQDFRIVSSILYI